MNEKLIGVQKEIIRLLKSLPNQEWATAEITIKFPPTSNKGYKMQPRFFDHQGEKLRIIPAHNDAQFEQAIFDWVVSSNVVNNLNEIQFSTKRDDYENSIITGVYNEQMVTDFEAGLSASAKNYTIWFKKPQA